MMKREPLNPDDPEIMAYLLGELTLAERVEFEARLQHSPLARRELESLEDTMSFLSSSLRREWQLGTNQPVLELLKPTSAPVSVAAPRELAPVLRAPRRRYFYGAAAAAAVAAVLVAVGSGVVEGSRQGGTETLASLPAVTAYADELVSGSVSISVPQLLLTEELDVSGMDFAKALESVEIDTSYLEQNGAVAAQVHPVSHRGAGSLAAAPVDSYLPPLNGDREVPALEMLDLHSGKTFAIGGSEDSRVLIRGYVPMGPVMASGKDADQGGKILAGFRPVAMSGNPVKSTSGIATGMREVRALQGDIQTLMEETTDPGEKARLQSLLRRSELIEKAISGN